MQQKKLQHKTSNDLEVKLLSQGYDRIVGIDEAGRGSWAGPVSVAGYVYDLKDELLPQVKDSKLIKEVKRLEIYNKLDSRRFFVAFADVKTIDRLNIYQAVIVKIKEIIKKYNDEKTFFLIDGNFNLNFGANTLQIIKGDYKHYSISAASIAAKVSRDLLMIKYSNKFPEYSFEYNKGYGTSAHLQALRRYGPCELHRISFAPIKSILKDNEHRIKR